jgi:pimeloyl-ACP methyl ester carboxylesterase
VFTPTLTGLAERSHLLTPDINLDTHILDVVNEVKWQELNNVVLVGHSYAGMVISGVAEKMEKSIASFVMLDAFFPETGQAVVDLQAPALRDALMAAERNGATTIPSRPAATFNINEKDRAWVDAQCTPLPIKCFLQKVTLTRARERIANKVYIRATGNPSEAFDRGMASARAKGWRTYEVPCGHYVMLDMPERLAEILQDAGSPRP